MSRIPFDQKAVDEKIAEIKALDVKDRTVIADAIKLDLRGWLLQTFEFTEFYEKRMALWPQSLREETGFGMATALLYDDWSLEITVPEVPEQPAQRTRHEQKVSGSGSSNGTYTVTKSHTWSW